MSWLNASSGGDGATTPIPGSTKQQVDKLRARQQQAGTSDTQVTNLEVAIKQTLHKNS
jgi:hypothetical protein